MKTTACCCGATLYFDNTSCSSCDRQVGWCDACGQLAAVERDSSTCLACGVGVTPCANRSAYSVCNGMIATGAGPLCRRCVTTTLVPDLSDPANVERWGVLEAGKRRLLYGLDAIGLGEAWREGEPPLRFKFAADQGDEKTLTGHADGVITINLKEADPVHREIARQEFGEPQRTVIGHLRHEFGHYLQKRLFGDEPGPEVTAVFGDPAPLDYSEALERYYENGPPEDWRDRHISAYASTHPWEDFAETASFYLDMQAVLDTLAAHGVIVTEVPADFDAAIASYQEAALRLNEVNRAMGLTDLVPYIVPPPVVEKLRLIDNGVRAAAGR
ncbi:putative zinc-binding metallopeptidase [Botrimarina mediterranea]|uniref:Zinc-ribbon domain-containing protein n=1 Tax=Botrimarina mediterranea TaxID=2528022 RepID=A0A518K5A4_9BACT|nr:putative zinc-binding metallopeptidase [Botrimarina mediterranea]QDV72979.1 hypothetical protein Spa11_11660 [Botrimarina mediterranea]QDV77553.1 hypothetical protein K2D_11490 [Planctomycetes bacterium K2D]